jgi:aldehyde dehydrogenase (NAD+)
MIERLGNFVIEAGNEGNVAMVTNVDPQLAVPKYLNGGLKGILIDGESQPAISGKTFDSINPATGQVIANLAAGDSEDIDRAVESSRRAFEGPWRKFTPTQRQNVMLKIADVLYQNFDELYLLDVFEMGMPIGFKGNMSSEFVTEILRYFAGWCTKISGETVPNSMPDSMFTYTLKEPVGVVGSIIPWNAPLTEMIWKLGPVLASGCTMVLKPAEEASLSPLRFAEIIQEYLPEGVVNVVTGYGETAGAALSSHPNVDKVSFTGSSFTGKEIVRASAGNLKRVTLELGGKSAHIVFADADLDKAAAAAGTGIFFNSGQNCAAGSRLFVERPVYEEFVERMSRIGDSMPVGNPLNPNTRIGPVVSELQLDRIMGYLESAKAEGARATIGGSRLVDGDLADGYFVAPTVFADVNDKMKIVQEEVFGPVVTVLAFDSVDEVIRRANDTQFGLAGGVWSRDINVALKVAHAIETGTMWVNTYNDFDPAVTYGGYKSSGWGKELGAQALDAYHNVKAVWIKTDV